MRVALVSAVAAVLALVVAGAAAPKEGARARLLTAVSRDAPPGTKVRIEWSVTIPDGHGGRQPFGAGGMFVQFLTKTGAATEPAFGTEVQTGRYVATATVPPGGVGGIRPGLRGTTDIYFPIENDPFRGKLGVVCDVRAVSGALHWFKGAFNTGDMPGLQALFSRTRFAWFSSTSPGLRIDPAARNRATLIAYFRARHRLHDRVLSFTFRFNGFEPGRWLGHFSLTGTRRADDFRGGEVFRFAAKGALDCAGQHARIAALSISTTG